MVRLHLVGFTTDLKNLIFADERGATTGGFVVSVDSRLRNTLEEVARLDEDVVEDAPELPEEVEEPEAPPVPRVVSKLSPKEIQSLLREGKTEEQVARLAGTEVDWIRRFSFAILAERRDVIDAVRAATLSKPRLGPSGMTIGDAVEENLGSKRLRMGAEAIEDAWKAMRKNGRWQVSFEYESRGQKRLARYSFDPNTRQVEPLNDIALELGWRADARSKSSTGRPASGAPKIVTGVRPGATRAAAKPAPPAKAPAKPSARPGGRGSGQERPTSAGTRPKTSAPTTRRATIAARSKEESARPQDQPVPRRRLVSPSEEIEQVKAPEPVEDKEDVTADEFIIQRPRNPERTTPEAAEYGSLPTVWRPSRRN
jgi:hypothetical protein